MKIQYYLIIGCVGVTIVIMFLILNYFKLETKPHTMMKIIGFNDAYNVHQIIKFQVYAEGYGHSCVGTPEIIVYKTNQTSTVVYDEKSKMFMCPMMPQMSSFSGYYPNQSDYYRIAIEQEGNYTLHVSYRDTIIEKTFLVTTK
ncbi:MAG TPA: hypothetical protein VFX64_05815 [Candidatus Nitrosotalea sp.]|nr:hypothetical protein [Candidatus Nitrosotalea sp.]